MIKFVMLASNLKNRRFKMIKYLLVVILVLFLQIPSIASVELPSKIEKVVVYTDSALVYRKTITKIKKGRNVFSLTGFPASLVDNSVSAGIIKGNAKIIDLKVEESYLVEQTQERIKSLKERIEKIDGEIKSLSGEMLAINNYIDFLKKLMPFSSNVKLLQGELEGYAKFVDMELKRSYKGIAEIEQKLDKLKEEKNNLEKELSNIGTKQEKIKNLILTVYGDREDDVEMELKYLVNNAMWKPQYDIHVDTLKGTIGLDLYASVTQGTAEDWRDVELVISTSKPVVGKLNDLSPWYVDIYRPREPVFYKSMGKGMEIVGSEMKEELAEDIKPETKEGAISFEFILKDKFTIPADNQPQKVFLATKTVDKGEKNSNLLEYVTIPKLSPFVFITGNFKNPFPFPIFPGSINIYLDKRFVRSEQLTRSFTSGEDISIPLGIDESINVERKLIKKFTEYTGIISKTERLIYEYEITVRNGKSKPVNITVKDNYPISQNEQIKTYLEKPSTKEAEIREDGILIWKIDLEPGATKRLEMRFYIEYLKGMRIKGIEQ
ncbi:MAG: mucoidy inhibitor MuiA family protein [Thermodesulfovibrionales bacterium]